MNNVPSKIHTLFLLPPFNLSLSLSTLTLPTYFFFSSNLQVEAKIAKNKRAEMS